MIVKVSDGYIRVEDISFIRCIPREGDCIVRFGGEDDPMILKGEDGEKVIKEMEAERAGRRPSDGFVSLERAVNGILALMEYEKGVRVEFELDGEPRILRDDG